MGIRGRVTRTNLAYANEHRDWRVFSEVATVLMRRARRLYAETPFELDLEVDLFALDATVIELSLALFPWARWQKQQASVKLNVLLDLRDDIPVFASLHEGNRHEVASLDETTGLHCDQTIRLSSRKGRKEYPKPLRRISYVDPETGQALVLLTNWFELPAFVITQIYRRRWGIELFFRWIKQHLRLRKFFSNSPNGVRVQIWAALCAYLLIAIAKKQKHLAPSLYEILQIVSICPLQQMPLEELLMKADTADAHLDIPNQWEINYS